jgi:hypothetical protein
LAGIRTGDIQLGKLAAMPRPTQNQAFGAGHAGRNVALAALIEHTIEHNFSDGGTIVCAGVTPKVLKRSIGIALGAVVAYAAYYLFGWIGLAIWAVIVITWFATQLISNQQVIMNTLLSRLPDRCAICHREIVDEGGIFDEEGIYHEACLEKIESLKELRIEAGEPSSGATHKPKVRASTRLTRFFSGLSNRDWLFLAPVLLVLLYWLLSALGFVHSK